MKNIKDSNKKRKERQERKKKWGDKGERRRSKKKREMVRKEKEKGRRQKGEMKKRLKRERRKIRGKVDIMKEKEKNRGGDNLAYFFHHHFIINFGQCKSTKKPGFRSSTQQRKDGDKIEAVEREREKEREKEWRRFQSSKKKKKKKSGVWRIFSYLTIYPFHHTPITSNETRSTIWVSFIFNLNTPSSIQLQLSAAKIL